jgi:hypothetical protein
MGKKTSLFSGNQHPVPGTQHQCLYVSLMIE